MPEPKFENRLLERLDLENFETMSKKCPGSSFATSKETIFSAKPFLMILECLNLFFFE